jgi:hypothetical protein
MRHVARFAILLGALASAAMFATALAPVAQAAFGPEVFEAGTCVNDTCTYPSVEANPKEAFTQAAGHPPWGITSFKMKHSGNNVEGASVRRIRVDVPAGLAANPQAPMPKCSVAQFNKEPKGCPTGSEVGTIDMEAVAEPLGLAQVPLPSLTGTVYNLEPPAGLPLDFGIAVEPAGELITPIRLFLEGHVDWSGDYHEFFEINEVPKEAEVKVLIGVKSALKVLSSKLNFNGNAGGNFLTVPSVCSSTTTSHLELESWTEEKSQTETHTPVGVTGCDKVPFSPSTTVTPETAQSDAPDGATTTVTVPQKTGAGDINTSDIKDAHVTLPEGLTLNPAAAHGLEACTAAQIGIGTRDPVSCPAGSIVGTVALETDLPPGSLTGNIYLGSPGGGLITDPPFTIYLVAQNTNLDVSVRLQGLVTPNPTTGRLEVTFADNPQLPFSELRLTLNGGAHAPLANPLVCGAATADSVFTPYTGGAAAITSTPFATTGCPVALPFALGQSTAHSSPSAGAYTSYTFNLARADGQQYLSQLKTVLPAGLVGAIPSVTLCGEPQAQAGVCTAASQIGVATASVGSGSDPYPFTGPVYLTGPYNGAPYGLSIPINAAAGPFSLGPVVTRAAISVDPHTARVIATSLLPTIVKGIPLRLKNLSVAINRSNFLFNPTNCGLLATESTLTSMFNAKQPLSTPFQVANCSALPFKPSFKTATSAKTSKLNGASLQVNLVQGAHQANMKSVVVSLPKQLPSRLTTLQKACPEATFAANPVNCRALGSEVGTATVATPVLPDKLTGSAYLVSHGGAAFPDLDLVLEGDGGVRVILTGNTNIKAGVTTSTFASIPDVPVSSFVLNLPVGPHSALTAIGGLCLKPLLMPTTITGQNGAQVKQNTRISVSDCGVRILSHRVVKHKLVIKLRTLGAGLIKLKGTGLPTVSRRVSKSATVTFKLPLTRGGLKALSKAHRSRRKLKINVHVAFTPKQKGQFGSAASATATFK